MSNSNFNFGMPWLKNQNQYPPGFGNAQVSFKQEAVDPLQDGLSDTGEDVENAYYGGLGIKKEYDNKHDMYQDSDFIDTSNVKGESMHFLETDMPNSNFAQMYQDPMFLQATKLKKEYVEEEEYKTVSRPIKAPMQTVMHTPYASDYDRKMQLKKKKPKGPMTAYAYFVQRCRKEVHNETVIFIDFSRKCSARWKLMTDNDKKDFHDLAIKDKERYDMEMKTFVSSFGYDFRPKKKKKDPNAPKRPLSAFFWFCMQERSSLKAENPNYAVSEMAKALGRKWYECDTEAKQKYVELANEDKLRYSQEISAYKMKLRQSPTTSDLAFNPLLQTK